MAKKIILYPLKFFFILYDFDNPDLLDSIVHLRYLKICHITTYVSLQLCPASILVGGGSVINEAYPF